MLSTMGIFSSLILGELALEKSLLVFLISIRLASITL